MNPTPDTALPPLPAPFAALKRDPEAHGSHDYYKDFTVNPPMDGFNVPMFTESQMQAYGAACRAASLKGEAAPLMRFTGYQLRCAADFVNPDPGDVDQLECKAFIQWGPARDHDEGGDPAGLRIWLADCPDEGSSHLYEEPDADAIAALSAAPRGALTEERIAAIMGRVDEHGRERWNTGCAETSFDSIGAARYDAAAVEVRRAIESDLRGTEAAPVKAAEPVVEALTSANLEAGVVAWFQTPVGDDGSDDYFQLRMRAAITAALTSHESTQRTEAAPSAVQGAEPDGTGGGEGWSVARKLAKLAWTSQPKITR